MAINVEGLASIGSADATQGAGDIPAMIERIAKEEGVGEDSALLVSLARRESGLNPAAKSPKSSAGGLFQFVDGTAQRVGLDDKFDAEKNARAAVKMFADHKRKFGGDARLALAAHHVGEGKARQALEDASVGDVDVSTQQWLADIYAGAGVGGGAGGTGDKPKGNSRYGIVDSPFDPRAFDRLEEQERRTRAQAKSDESPISTSLGRGWEQMTDSVGNYIDLIGGDEAAIIERMENWQKYDAENPMPSAAKRFMDDWQDENYVGAMMNPSGLFGGMTEQLANSLPAMAGSIPGMLVGGAYGAPMGPLGILLGATVGGAAGSAPGSVAIETGARLPAMMAADGVDISDAGSVSSWLQQNRDRVLEEGAKKGLTVAALDGAAMGVGSALVMKPAVRFAQAESRIFANMGVKTGDKAAMEAARKTPQYAVAIKPFQAELKAASTAANNAMRGFASFAAETAGEVGGEYYGEVAATGEGNLNEALLEGVMAGGQSAVTTGAQFVGGKAMAAIKPNSPLTNAANLAGQASQEAAAQGQVAPAQDQGQQDASAQPEQEPAAEVSEFDQRLSAAQSFVEDKAFLQALRGTEGFGKESVTELLSAYAKARNPNVDELVRERALADIERFIETFNSRPNFTIPGAAEGQGTDVVPAGRNEVGPARQPRAQDDGQTIDGEVVTRPAQIEGQGPKALPTEEVIQAKRQADADYDQAYQDLVKAEQLGASDEELMQYRQTLEEAKAQQEALSAQLEDVARRVEGTQQQEADGRRRALLDNILDDPNTVNPSARFAAELRRNGYADAAPSAAELDIIKRFEDAREALAQAESVEPAAPNEMPAEVVPERVETEQPEAKKTHEEKIEEIKALVRAGWKPVNGRKLVSPSGKVRKLNPLEFAAAKEEYRKIKKEEADAVQPAPTFTEREQGANLNAQEGAKNAQTEQAQADAMAEVVERDAAPVAAEVAAKPEADAVDEAEGDAEVQDSGDVSSEPEIKSELDAAAHEAATSPLNDRPHPSDEQKSAGNYKVGKIRLHGMDISIENPRGSVRSGVAPDGTRWESRMAHHYGYVRGSEGRDGDHLDVFLTDGADAAKVAWVIDQKNADDSFDEHKIVIGPATEQEARDAYLANYDEGWDGIGAITSMPMEAFKAWALDGKKKRKPLAYVESAVVKESLTTEADAPNHPVSGRVDRSGIPEFKVFYQDRNGKLWGIPYEMRAGQQPADINPAFRGDWWLLSGAKWVGDKALTKAEALAAEAVGSRGEWVDVAQDAETGVVDQNQAKVSDNADSISQTSDNDALTADEATRRMEWRDGGQRDGERRHTLIFKESEGDKNGFSVATLRKYGKGKWVLDDAEMDGDVETFDGLREAKRAGLARALKYLEREGYVEKADATAETVAQKAEPDAAEGSATEQQGQDGALEDFGEKLGGARKDLQRAMDREFSDEELATLPLSKIWPAEEIDKIDSKVVAAFAFAARSEIPPKPRKKYKLASWIGKVKSLRSIVSEISGTEDTAAKILDRLKGWRVIPHFGAKVALLNAIERDNWKRIGSVAEHPDAYTYTDGKQVGAPYVSVDVDGNYEAFRGAKSVADVVEKVEALLGAEQKSKRMQFDVRGSGNSFFINKKGDREYRRLKTFSTAKEAFEYIKNDYDALVQAWEDVKERDNVSKRDVRGEDNRPRTGKDWRNGEDVTPEQFSDVFGFRGVEFGNWVGQGDGDKGRQGMLNQAFDALSDLADILGIPSRAVSLNGTLGLAFGSRGKGRASAHFEPSRVVINLTKTRGAGSLAHEWFHALDNYFSRQREGEVAISSKSLNAQEAYRTQNFITYRPEPMYVRADGNTSSRLTKAKLQRYREQASGSKYYDESAWRIDPSHPEGVRQQVERAFAELVETLDASPMAQRSKGLDKEPDGYWSRIIERGARAFENYIISKMAQGGYDNDYLANVRSIEDFPRSSDRYPYLLPDEIAPVEEAFDNLFSTIESKETDQGVALFRFDSEETDGGVGVSRVEADAIVRDFVAAFPGSPKIEVVDSFDQLPISVQADARSQGAQPGSTKGAYLHGRKSAFVVVGNHTNRADLEATLFHEVLGHAGVRKMFGSEFVQEQNKLFMALGGIDGLTKIMRERGLDGHFDRYVENLIAANKENPARWTEDKVRFILTEEVFAHVAEQQKSKPGLRDRFMALIGMVRNLLRKTGLVKLAELGETDLLFMLNRARKTMKKGDASIVRDGVDVSQGQIRDADGNLIADESDEEYGALRTAAEVLGLVESQREATVFRTDGDAQPGGSNIMRQRIDNSNLRNAVFTALAKFDDSFQQPRATQKTLDAIAKEIDPGFRVVDKPGGFAKMKTKGRAVKAWEIFPRDQQTRSGFIFEDARGRVWVDVQRLIPGVDQGNKIYGIVAGYAHNNGKVFIGDPAGLSETGFFRRLENMISSALKYGTTDHIYPHAAQIDPEGYYEAEGEPEKAKRLKGLGIDWKEGDFSHNLTQMLEASYNGAVRFAPELKDIVYDFNSRQFVDVSSGERRSKREFEDLSSGIRARSSKGHRGGSTTYARAAIYNSLVREGSREGRRNLLAQISDQLSGRGLDFELHNLFYQRNAGEKKGGLTADTFRSALVERFGEEGVSRLEELGLLNISSPEGQDSSSPAWYDTNSKQAYFVPEFMADAKAAVGAVLHEIGEHHGLESFLGPRAWRTLKARIASLHKEGGNDVQAAWDGVLDTYPEFAGMSRSALIESDRFMHEVIAKIGESAAGRKSSLWRDILMAVNRFLLKMGLGRQINKNELADLVAGSLARVMRGEGGDGPKGRHADSAGAPASVLKSIQPSARSVTANRLQRFVSEFRRGKMSAEFNQVLGDTPNVLRAVGAPPLPLEISAGALSHIVSDRHAHEITLDMVAEAIDGLYDPDAVFASKQHKGSLVALTSVNDRRGNPVVVALHMGKVAGRLRVNKIASAYGKESPASVFEKWAKDGLLLYAHKERSLEAPTTSRLYLPSVVQMAQDSGKKFITDIDVVKEFGRMYARQGEADQESHGQGAMRQRAFSLHDYMQSPEAKKSVRERIGDAIAAAFDGSTARTFNLWERTVGTQYGKSRKDGHFRRVYESAHAFVDDVSRFANEAADKARDILPHMDGLKDIAEGLNMRKAWSDAKDYEAVASAIFDGTLEGKHFSAKDLEERFGLNEKQQEVYRQFRAAVDASLESLAASEMARAARAAKLEVADASMSMDEAEDFYVSQIEPLIEEARALVHDKAGPLSTRHMEERAAVEDMAKSGEYDADAIKAIRSAMLARHRSETDGAMKTLYELEVLRDSFTDKADKIRDLSGQGYAPLMRYGQYVVDVVRLDEDGSVMTEGGEPDRPFFGMFETEAEAKEAAKILAEEYPEYTVSRGVLSELANQQFKGLTPEVAELFARLLGTSENEAFQAYLKQAVANRSAMKRLIHRKGMAGFSQDVPRVLASFITSNARLTSGNWHFGEMSAAIADIPKRKGDVQDEAIKLAQYIQNPQEEAAGIRGFMFFNFLGGSVAAAMVNLTQTASTTFPFLSQWGAKDAAKAITKAMSRSARVMKDGKFDSIVDAPLREALARASEEGIIDPQEIHLLMAEASGSDGLTGAVSKAVGKINKGAEVPVTRVGRAFMQAWGSMFGAAEKYNRHVAFMAAWDMAPAGVDRYSFAKDAVVATQFDYTKSSRANWGRGPIGATLFTFRTFMVSYIEFLGRLPSRERAIAIAVLMLLSGMSGLPGADDLDDVIDTIGQKMGYNWNNAASRHAWLVKTLGVDGTNMLEHGLSSIIPLDVSARLGMGNLFPMTGLFKKSNEDKGREAAEVFGAPGAFAKNLVEVIDRIGTGRPAMEATLPALPKAVSDAYKAVDMLQTGAYRDGRGRKVVDVTAADAFIKAIGFQPNRVAEPRRVEWMLAQSSAMFRTARDEIHDLWARGVAERDSDKIDSAREAMVSWNRKNPKERISINPASIRNRVRAMRLTSAERLVKATPKDMRGMLSAELEAR